MSLSIQYVATFSSTVPSPSLYSSFRKRQFKYRSPRFVLLMRQIGICKKGQIQKLKDWMLQSRKFRHLRRGQQGFARVLASGGSGKARQYPYTLHRHSCFLCLSLKFAHLFCAPDSQDFLGDVRQSFFFSLKRQKNLRFKAKPLLLDKMQPY